MMRRTILLPDGKTLKLWYATTHRTFYTADSLATARKRNEYVTRVFYERLGNGSYALMAYQCGQRPSALLSVWGIYRVDAHPGYSYPEGNYTVLKDDMTRKEAVRQLPEIVVDDPGHIHAYHISKRFLQLYRDGIMSVLTAHCWHCSHCLYNEKVEILLVNGTVSID